MRREFSAGGVLVRRLGGRWMVAAIRPAGKPPGVWALPKGLIGPGESAEATAVREVLEEVMAGLLPVAEYGAALLVWLDARRRARLARRGRDGYRECEATA